jgi:hypothetical protein
MKRVFMLVILTFLIGFNIALSVSAKTSTAANNENQRKYVLSNIRGVICDTYSDCDGIMRNLKLNSEKVYDIFLDKYGTVYEFSSDKYSVSGFVILRDEVDLKNSYSIDEIILGGQSPYQYKEYKNIYFGVGQYYEVKGDILLDSINGVYYDYNLLLETIGLSDEEISIIFSGVTNLDDEPHNNTEETYIYYDMVQTEVTTSYGYPLMDTEIRDYASSNAGSNCSPTAGLSLVLYYDRLYPNQGISNVYSVTSGSPEQFYNWDDYLNGNTASSGDLNDDIDVYDYLYDEMGTNGYLPWVSWGGTPHSWFVSGLEDYFDYVYKDMHIDDLIGDSTEFVSNYNTSFKDAGKWDEYKGKIDSDIPVVIQLGGFNDMFYTILYNWDIDYNENSHTRPGPYGSVFQLDSVEYTYSTYSGVGYMHTVVGYGYLENELYDIDTWGWLDDDPFRVDKFAIVSLGWGYKGYINYDSVAISQAYAITLTNKISPC